MEHCTAGVRIPVMDSGSFKRYSPWLAQNLPISSCLLWIHVNSTAMKHLKLPLAQQNECRIYVLIFFSNQNTFWAEVFGREFARCCHFLGESTGHLHTSSSHSRSKSFDSVPLDGNKSDTATCSWCSQYLPESLSPSAFALLVTSSDRTRIYSFEDNRKALASSI